MFCFQKELLKFVKLNKFIGLHWGSQRLMKVFEASKGLKVISSKISLLSYWCKITQLKSSSTQKLKA